MSTATTILNRPSEQEWLDSLRILSLLRYSEIRIDLPYGEAIWVGLRNKPFDAVRTMREQGRDCPEVMRDIIGEFNLKLVI